MLHGQRVWIEFEWCAHQWSRCQIAIRKTNEPLSFSWGVYWQSSWAQHVAWVSMNFSANEGSQSWLEHYDLFTCSLIKCYVVVFFFVVVTRISHISQYYHVPIDSNHRENLEEYWIFLSFFSSWKWCTTPYPANKWQKIIINKERWYWLSQRQLPYTAIAKERKE